MIFVQDKHRGIILGLIYGVVSVLIISGIIVMAGLVIKPHVQLYTHDFEWDEIEGRIILRFQSDTGVFTAGEKIHVNSLLEYPVSTESPKHYFLYFPNSLNQENYEQLISDSFWRIETDDSSFTINPPYSQILINVGVIPPMTEFDVTWTQEGLQEGILIMNETSLKIENIGIKYDDEIILKNMINIQSSDVYLQIQSNNYSSGLALIIIAITILTAFFGIEKIWFLLKSEPIHQNKRKT